MVVGLSTDERIWVLDTWAKRAGTQEIVEMLLNFCERWNPLIAAYEDVAQQSLLWDPILQASLTRGITVPLTGVKVRTTVDKNWRIRSILQPLIGQGRLMVQAQHRDLIAEITQFPMSNLKDLIDALAGACSLIRPPVRQGQRAQSSRDLARWLRETGMSPDEIEREVSRVGRELSEDYMPRWQRELREARQLREMA